MGVNMGVPLYLAIFGVTVSLIVKKKYKKIMNVDFSKEKFKASHNNDTIVIAIGPTELISCFIYSP